MPKTPTQQQNIQPINHPPAGMNHQQQYVQQHQQQQQQQQQPMMVAPFQQNTLTQPTAAIVQSASTPQIIAQNPNTRIVFLGSQPPQKKEKMYDKEEFGEMLMMQFTQMNHMVMQRHMMNQLSGGDNSVSGGYCGCGPYGGCCSSHGSCHGGCHH